MDEYLSLLLQFNMEHFFDQHVKETTKMRILSLNLRQTEQ